MIAFLNLDRVIEIIRTEDEPKAVMIAEFELTDRQAEAILNMRLRQLRKLEEMEIGKERDALAKEREGLAAAGREPDAAAHPAEEGAGGAEGGLCGRRAADAGAWSRRRRASSTGRQMIEKEPITVILSQRGWIRAMRGHVALARDRRASSSARATGCGTADFHAQTTDRLLVAADNGRVYTLGGDKLPGGRGFGEPIRLTIDLEAESEIIAMFVVRPEHADAGGVAATGAGS